MMYSKMTSNINEIGKKALELSARDRALLIRQLLESLEGGEEEENAEELWIDEVKRRYDRYKQGKTSEKPANQVLKNAKANLK
jgi:putative addiction module component (TIGR02574 family)